MFQTNSPISFRSPALKVVPTLALLLGVGVLTSGLAEARTATTTASSVAQYQPQPVCNPTCTPPCSVPDLDLGGQYTCMPTAACSACVAGEPASPPMCPPQIDPSDPYYLACFPPDPGDPPTPPLERALLVTNTSGSISAFVTELENAYHGLMDFDGTYHWGPLVNMRSAPGGTPAGAPQEFVLRTAAYRSRCHDQFTVKFDLDIDPGVTVRFLADGAQTHSFTGPNVQTDSQITWTGSRTMVLKVVYDTSGLSVGPPPAFDMGFHMKEYRVGASAGTCSPVVQLNDQTARTALAGAGGTSPQVAAINAIAGAANFPVEADGPMQHQASATAGPFTRTLGPVGATADPWMADQVTSLRNLIDCDPAGATCADPTNGGSAKAWDRHGGGHPGITIAQIDTSLDSEAMLATGDHRLPSLWFHDDGVSNEDPLGGSTSACQPFGNCVGHPAGAHDEHGTGTSSWFSILHDGNGFMATTPRSTWWFAGIGLDFNELSIATYSVAVSDVIARLDEMDPNQIDVVSLSFGTAVPTVALAKAIAAYTDLGVVFVAAAGNEANDSPIYPASASNVIGVGSTGTYDFSTKTYSSLNELSVFELPFPGFWASNKGGDVVMPGAGPLVDIVQYKCAITGNLCVTNEQCDTQVNPLDTCTDQDNFYNEFTGQGTSHSAPQIAALFANTLGDILHVNPQDYPAIHAALATLPASEQRPYLAAVVKAALFQSAERWFGTIELPHEEFGYGRGDHMAIMDFLIAGGAPNSTPGQYAVTSTDIDRSLFTKDFGQTTWDDLEPTRMGMVGAGDANPTQTDFRSARGETVGACSDFFHSLELAIGSLFGEPLKVEVSDPYVTHETDHYNHQKTDLPNEHVLVEFNLQQRIVVRIPTKRWGLLECLLPFLFSPIDQDFFSIIEQQNLSASNRKNYTMEYELDGLGYNHDLGDLMVLNNPPLKPFKITPTCCSMFEGMSMEIEERMKDLDQFLRTAVLQSVELEAMEMVETALDAHLAFNRTTPQQYWTTRFQNSHASWSPPQFQHWLPGDPPLGAEHKNLDLAPLFPLSSVGKVPILRPVLDPGEEAHLYVPYAPEIDILDPLMEPISEPQRWDDVSYQSVNTIREQLNQADLNDAHAPGGFNELFVTPNGKVSDAKIRFEDLQQRNVRPTVQFYPAETADGHYGHITSSHEATLLTCVNDPVDRPPELVQPLPAFDCTLQNHGTVRFDLTFYLHRNDWYAAYPASEKAQAGNYHHFENRLTVDPEFTTIQVTQSPGTLSWWDGGSDPCDDISDPYQIARNCDLRKEEAEATLLGLYGPTMTRLVDSMSFDRFGLNAHLGVHYLTLMRQLDFLNQYLNDMYGFVYDGFDYDVGTMDGTLSTPEWELLEQPGAAAVMVHKIQLDRAPAGERDGGLYADLVQPDGPGTGATLTSQSIGIQYGRCENDTSIACDDDNQCGGTNDDCISLRFCSFNGGGPSSYPLDTCTEANIVADCGTSSLWECNRVPTRSRFADHADVGVGNTAKQSTASVNESYFTVYQDGSSSVGVDSDLWLAMAYAPDSVFAVDLEPGSSLRKPDAQPLDHNFTVDGFSRWEKSLVRSDTCLWRANLFFTYDRWANCPAGGTGCSQEFETRHTGYSLTPTRANWDVNPEDGSCGGGCTGPGCGGGVITTADQIDSELDPIKPGFGDPPWEHGEN